MNIRFKRSHAIITIVVIAAVTVIVTILLWNPSPQPTTKDTASPPKGEKR